MNKEKFIILITAVNKAGVLNKILSLCRRRRYSLQSVTAGPTEKANIYNITLVLFENKNRVDQIVNQINKIIEVISTNAFIPKDVIDKELILIILKNKKSTDKILKNNEHDINVRVLKKINNNFILEIIGEGTEVDHALSLLSKKDIVKLVRSGSVAIKL
jgi:acetolactate synthase-1/3 small subunit